MLIDINTQVASFRDMLIHIGHDKHDCPELRAQIRKTRRACVESCIKVAKMILPQLKRFEYTNNTFNGDMFQSIKGFRGVKRGGSCLQIR